MSVSCDIALLRQPCGFEGLPAEAKGMECARQSQVILRTKDPPVPHPEAVEQFALQVEAAPSPCGCEARADQDAVVTDRGDRPDPKLEVFPGLLELAEKASNLRDAM